MTFVKLVPSLLASFALTASLVACGESTPPAATAANASATTTPASTQDIVATAQGAGSFKTLVTALKAADLDTTLKGDGPFTVFAPTDEAFAKLPAGTVESLLKPENKAKLTAILTYHVVPGNVSSADVVKVTSAKTVNGKSLAVSAAGGSTSTRRRSRRRTSVARAASST
ncbi:MAG: fasciclin domain-containing protein [Polyangiaceae bacterium]